MKNKGITLSHLPDEGVNSFATYAHSPRIFQRKFFIVFELKERESMNNFQRAVVTRGHTCMLQVNRAIPGSKNSHFQKEA